MTKRSRTISAIAMLAICSSLNAQVHDGKGAIFAIAATGPGSATLMRIQRHAPFRARVVATLQSPQTTLRSFGSFVYAVDTEADRILMFGTSGAPIRVITAPPGSKPRDIWVVSSDRAYVTMAGDTRLFRVNPLVGSMQPVIDLAPFADADTNPDMERMICDGERLYLQLKRDSLGPGALSAALAVFDLATETLVDTNPKTPQIDVIELSGPSARLPMIIDVDRSFLLVSATAPDHLEVSGGIERVDLQQLRSQGFVVAEQDIASLGGFVLKNRDEGYLLFHTDIVASNHLVEFTLAGGAKIGPEVVFDFGHYLDALLFDPMTKYLFMPSSASGLYVVNTRTNQPVSGGPTKLPGLVTDQVIVGPRSPVAELP